MRRTRGVATIDLALPVVGFTVAFENAVVAGSAVVALLVNGWADVAFASGGDVVAAAMATHRMTTIAAYFNIFVPGKWHHQINRYSTNKHRKFSSRNTEHDRSSKSLH